MTKSKLSKDFYLFRMGQFVSVLGVRSGQIAVAWWVMETTDSAAALSLVLAPSMIARICLIPIFGPLGDMFSRKKCALFADVWNGLISILVLVVALNGLFSIHILAVLLSLISIGYAIMSPLDVSLVSNLVAEDQLDSAIQYSSVFGTSGMVVGAALGGVIVSILGVSSALLFDCISFFMAALFTLFISDKKMMAGRLQNKTSLSYKRHLINWKDSFIQGIRMYRRITLEWLWALLAMIINFCLVPFIFVFIPSFVHNSLKMESWYFGLLEFCFSFGALVSSFFLTKTINKFVHKDFSLIGSLFIVCLCMFQLYHLQNIYLIPMVMFTLGLALLIHNINAMTQRTKAIPNEFRARLFSCGRFFIEVSIPLGTVIVGFAIKDIGYNLTILFLGSMVLTATLGFLFLPNLKIIMRNDSKETMGLYSRLYPKAFQ